MLRGFRTARDESLVSVATRLDRLLKYRDRPLGAESSEIEERFRTRGIDIIEEPSEGPISLTSWDLQILADAYDVHQLLLEPLFARTTDDLCLLERFEEFRILSKGGHTGRDCIYRSPRQRLAEADTAWIR